MIWIHQTNLVFLSSVVGCLPDGGLHGGKGQGHGEGSRALEGGPEQDDEIYKVGFSAAAVACGQISAVFSTHISVFKNFHSNVLFHLDIYNCSILILPGMENLQLLTR